MIPKIDIKILKNISIFIELLEESNTYLFTLIHPGKEGTLDSKPGWLQNQFSNLIRSLFLE